MVDPTQVTGSLQNILQPKRTQSATVAQDVKPEKTEGTAPKDEVNISSEALDLAAAEKTATETKTILEELQEETLSSDITKLGDLYDTEA